VSIGRQHQEIADWMSALPLGEMWHTGIVVADLDVAVADFRTRSGVRFTAPHIVPLTIRQRDVADLADVRVSSRRFPEPFTRRGRCTWVSGPTASRPPWPR